MDKLFLSCNYCDSDDVKIIQEDSEYITLKCNKCNKETSLCKGCVEAAQEAFKEFSTDMFEELFTNDNNETIINDILDLMGEKDKKDG